MNTRPLTSYKVIVFDVYGTLVDWDSGMYNALLPVSPSGWTREDVLLAYSELEVKLQSQHPDMLYRDLMAKAHQVFCDSFHDVGVESSPPEGKSSMESPHTQFAESLKSWPIFPDTVSALQILASHFKLVVLSNVDKKSFAATHTRLAGGLEGNDEEQEGLEQDQERKLHQKDPFTLILTAQDTGAYKPSLKGLQHALSAFENSREFGYATKDDVLVVASSLYHDHIPANKLGLNTVWIDRKGAVMGVEKRFMKKAKWGFRFSTLGEMTEEIDKELKSDSGMVAE